MNAIKAVAKCYFDTQVNTQVVAQPTFVDFVQFAKTIGTHAVMDPSASKKHHMVYTIAYALALTKYEEARDGNVSYDRQKAAPPMFM